VVNDLVAMRFGNRVLTLLYFVVDKLDHLIGIHIDHMIVVMV
jgi:hypothetical protein